MPYSEHYFNAWHTICMPEAHVEVNERAILANEESQRLLRERTEAVKKQEKWQRMVGAPIVPGIFLLLFTPEIVALLHEQFPSFSREMVMGLYVLTLGVGILGAIGTAVEKRSKYDDRIAEIDKELGTDAPATS